AFGHNARAPNLRLQLAKFRNDAPLRIGHIVLRANGHPNVGRNQNHNVTRSSRKVGIGELATQKVSDDCTHRSLNTHRPANIAEPHAPRSRFAAHPPSGSHLYGTGHVLDVDDAARLFHHDLTTTACRGHRSTRSSDAYAAAPRVGVDGPARIVDADISAL